MPTYTGMGSNFKWKEGKQSALDTYSGMTTSYKFIIHPAQLQIKYLGGKNSWEKTERATKNFLFKSHIEGNGM
ncbi:hypothetical protein J437_LFUL014265 [Ladona fulva]|uniref:Uncharacterized protein n=1 Tax=Ladona fulva TaxID=123851 RepID=A0A8K0P468_LADFU|nr:hypothetical protein J437_LFUL014265 [Ladona fulva]